MKQTIVGPNSKITVYDMPFNESQNFGVYIATILGITVVAISLR
jgi:hypothetical protein